ncbi:hypothetical protein QTP88_022693 [Uroleucon formosanum]
MAMFKLKIIIPALILLNTQVNDAKHMISVSHYFRYVVVGPKKNTTLDYITLGAEKIPATSTLNVHSLLLVCLNLIKRIKYITKYYILDYNAVVYWFVSIVAIHGCTFSNRHVGTLQSAVLYLRFNGAAYIVVGVTG